MTVNFEIKKAAKQAGVCLWQVAEALGIPDHEFSRKLRHELPQAEKERIFTIISKIAEGGAAD